VQLHRLEASFPTPSTAALADAAAKLRAIGDDERVLIDGLALGAMPEIAQRERERLRLIGLVHHLLADETGLSEQRRAALLSSEQRALAATRQLVVTSAATANRLAQLGLDQLGFEQLGLEQTGLQRGSIAVIEPGTDPAPLAERRGQAPLRLLSVGALIPRKGHRFLIAALGSLQDLPWQLEIIGCPRRHPPTSAALRQQLEQLGLASRVQLRGEVDDADLQAAYRRADLFVLPSLFEGYGMAFSEALAHGLPILGCAAGAISDTVPEDAGLLVAPGSSSALTSALRQLLSDAGLRQRLAAGAERARLRLPDWPQQCQAWARLLSDV
jgi:glycosyltransferase involved in cell wall biosynthesis